MQVIALGGNSLSHGNESYKEQISKTEKTINSIRHLLKEKTVLTHGNGPQVGDLLLRMPALPLNALVAMTQAEIGEMICESLPNAKVVLTHCVVDEKDSAFSKPTKPIGPFYKVKKEGIIMDAGRGYRKVVASPIPRKILEMDEIKYLAKRYDTIIAGGGGGIPVVERKGQWDGVEAVIDKDYTTQLIASEVKAKEMMFITDVPYVYENFRMKEQKEIRKIKINELQGMKFSEGSMAPKIRAAIKFIKKGGKKVIITSLSNIKKGTVIT